MEKNKTPNAYSQYSSASSSGWSKEQGVNQDRANKMEAGVKKAGAMPEWITNAYSALTGAKSKSDTSRE